MKIITGSLCTASSDLGRALRSDSVANRAGSMSLPPLRPGLEPELPDSGVPLPEPEPEPDTEDTEDAGGET